MACTFRSLALSGTYTVAGTPNVCAAYATPWPWLPADAVMTPAARCSAGIRISLWSAPRTLKERVGWTPSILRYTWQPDLAVNAREYWRGVGGRWAPSAVPAASIASAVTGRRSVLGRAVVSGKTTHLNRPTIGTMSEDADELPARERARVRHRDRKVRGPRMVVDNAGLKKLAMHLAEKRRRRRPQPPPAKPAGVSPALARWRACASPSPARSPRPPCGTR